MMVTAEHEIKVDSIIGTSVSYLGGFYSRSSESWTVGSGSYQLYGSVMSLLLLPDLLSEINVML
jgi:hypothetical protein